MGEAAHTRKMSPAEYLELERASEVKHEYAEGEIFAMSCGTFEHSATAANITRALGNALAGSRCTVLTSDMRVHIPSTGRYVYPDGSVVCNKPEFQDDKRDTLLNPIVVIEVFGDADRCQALRSRGSDGPIEIVAAWSQDGSAGRARLSLDLDLQGGGAPTGRIDVAWSGEERVVTQELTDKVELVELPKFPPFLSGASLLQFQRKILAEPAYTERVPRIAPDGTGLAAALTDLAVTWPDRFQAVQAALREIIPAVERVRLVRAPVQRIEWESITVDKERISRPVTRQYAGYEIVFDMRGASDVPARLASEGTMLVLGLLTVLHGPNEGRLVLLDDIDRALHPRAQSDLVKQLRRLLQIHPDLQIIATSHSPYLLDDLRYEEIRLTTLQDDGSALCAPLTEHPDYPRWKDHMHPGEFWSMVAEDWIKLRGDNGDE